MYCSTSGSSINNFSLTFPNNNSSSTSFNESTSFILPAPIQQTTFDDDIPLPSDATSYVNLQPYPFDLVAQSSSPQQISLIQEGETNTNGRHSIDTSCTSLAFDNHASSTPIVAVRHVINSFLSERDVQLSMSNSPSNRCRDSRLENKIGLNITEDEYVLSKLKEKEQKKANSISKATFIKRSSSYIYK